jgi:hypothetical protein
VVGGVLGGAGLPVVHGGGKVGEEPFHGRVGGLRELGGPRLGVLGRQALGEPAYHQRGHPRAPVGLNPDHHLPRAIGLAQVPGDQLVELRDPGHALVQPDPGQPPPGLIDQAHVVMIFRPVVADIQHRLLPALPPIVTLASQQEDHRDLMDQCSGTTSHQRSASPADQPGTL